ncbi:MAG: hypothetical protein KatS3mg106_224 [Gemmataceae bacterium]|nr:MAG: hypothetical protein KatS3mg106_224 [Gemmataceae bacterium]
MPVTFYRFCERVSIEHSWGSGPSHFWQSLDAALLAAFLEAVGDAPARAVVLPLVRPLPLDLLSFFPKMASYPSANRGSSDIPTRTILTAAHLRSQVTIDADLTPVCLT